MRMITYEDIYEAARKERYSEQLQPVIDNFVSEVSDYLKDKKKIVLKDDDAFSDTTMRTKKQLENAITLFRELMLRRRKKILSLVLIAAETGISKKDFENMLIFEKELFDNLIHCLDGADKVLNDNLNGNNLDLNSKMVLFLKPVDEFVGLNGEKLGPYIEGQMANLPKGIADILIGDNSAEVVER